MLMNNCRDFCLENIKVLLGIDNSKDIPACQEISGEIELQRKESNPQGGFVRIEPDPALKERPCPRHVSLSLPFPDGSLDPIKWLCGMQAQDPRVTLKFWITKMEKIFPYVAKARFKRDFEFVAMAYSRYS